MEIKESVSRKGWIGFFIKDENDYPEEIISVRRLLDAKRMVRRLQKNIEELNKKKETIRR